MAQRLKYILLVLAMVGMALTAVVHADDDSHDHEKGDCSFCLIKPFESIPTPSLDIQEPVTTFLFEIKWAFDTYLVEQFVATYSSRAPPFAA